MESAAVEDWLNRVELQFALSDTDDKFERVLGASLGKLLLALGHCPKRGIEIVTHVHTLLKANRSLSVPVKPLLDLLSGDSLGALGQNLCLVFLDMGISRLSAEENSSALIPDLVKGWSNGRRTEAQQQILFSILLPILAYLPSSKTKTSESTAAHGTFFTENSDPDVKLLLQRLLDVLMYTVPPAAPTKGAKTARPPPPPVPTYGLGPASIQFITNAGKSPWAHNSQELHKVKTGILAFIFTQDYVSDAGFAAEKYAMFLWASADPYSEVSAAGENGLKHMIKPDFESVEVLKAFYRMYQGGGKDIKAMVNPLTGVDKDDSHHRVPASSAVKLRLLNSVFTKSKAACLQPFFPRFVHVAFDAVFAEKTLKVQLAGMAFLLWILQNAKQEIIETFVGASVLAAVPQLVGRKAHSQPSALRAAAYEVLGSLARRAPPLFSDDFKMIKELFGALDSETDDSVRFSIQSCLMSMTSAFKADVGSMSEQRKQQIEMVLLENAAKNNHFPRYAAVKFGNSVFPFSEPLARMLCLYLSNDSKMEIKDESRQGLTFSEGRFWSQTDAALQQQDSHALPKLGDMLTLILKFIHTEDTVSGVKKTFGKLDSSTLANAVTFSRKLLIFTADPDTDKQSLNRVLEAEEFTDLGSETRGRLSVWLCNNPEALTPYADLLDFTLFCPHSDSHLQAVAAQYLLELIMYGPSFLRQMYSSKVEQLMKLLCAIRSTTRTSIAHILGIVATGELEVDKNKEQFAGLVDSMIAAIEGPEKLFSHELKNGSYIGLGYLIGRLIYRYQDKGKNYLPEARICRALLLLNDALDPKYRDFNRTSCLALAEATRYSVGTMAFHVETSDSGSGMTVEQHWKIEDVVEQLFKVAKESTDNKLQETSLVTLGHMAIGKPEIAHKVTEFFFDLSSMTTKNMELCFSIGESLCAIAYGFEATNMEIFLDLEDAPKVRQSASEEGAALLLSKVLDWTKPVQSPVNRKNAVIWLLCMVKYIGKSTAIQQSLVQIHSAFSSLLGDRDDLIQDVASKGIGLLYDLGDDTMRERLIGSLVNVLSEGRKVAAQSVTNDTVLFDETALGSTPTGESISTYQSVLSLAADLNQPDLVYRFMSLASHNAIWNSKKGASLGFSSIAAKAKHELAPHLKKIIPKLYRYQFDPNHHIAENMKNIWLTLVSEPAKSVNDNFDSIMKELLACIVDRQWRSREASCSAIADLIHGRQLAELEPYLQELWSLCFRALDDIKESVRVAAFSTCKALTNFTLKYSDSDNASSKDSAKVLSVVVPFFLTKGIGSMSEDVRYFSLKTLLKICDKGGPLLKAHATDIMITLLEGLSSLEPQVMNYLSFHADKYNISQEQMEATRLNATKGSPMMVAIERCLDQVDAKILEELAPKICNLVRKGIGLPTKAGTSRIICSLATRCPTDVTPHAPALLKALSGVVQDRSAVLRKATSAAAGHVARLVPDSTVVQYIQHVTKFYLESEDDDLKHITPIALMELARYAPDKVKSVMSEVLPVTFIGIHDPAKDLKTQWTAVWDELAAGSTSACRLWIIEIMALCERLLKDSQSWPIKRQVAKSLATLAQSSGNTFDDHRAKTFSILLESLGGWTWDGKEDILESLGQLSIESKKWLMEQSDKTLQNEIIRVAIRESKKTNKNYRRIAIECLGKIAYELEQDVFSDVLEYFTGVVQPKDAEDEMDVDDDEPRDKPLVLVIQANTYKAIGRCFAKPLRLQDEWTTLIQLLSDGTKASPWNIRTAILEGMEVIFGKTKKIDTISATSRQMLLESLYFSLEDAKYTGVREACLRVLKLVVPLLTSSGLSPEERADIKERLKRYADKESSTLLADYLGALSAAL